MKASEIMIIIVACFASAILTALFMRVSGDQLLSVVAWVLIAVLIGSLCFLGLYGIYLVREGYDELGYKGKDVVQLLGLFPMVTLTIGFFISVFSSYSFAQSSLAGTLSDTILPILASCLPSQTNWLPYLVGSLASIIICYITERQDLKDRLKATILKGGTTRVGSTKNKRGEN